MKTEQPHPEKAMEGVVTYGHNPSLVLAPPRAAVGIFYLLFLHVLPQDFVTLFSFL